MSADRRAVVLLSGGLDSYTAAAMVKAQAVAAKTQPAHHSDAVLSVDLSPDDAACCEDVAGHQCTLRRIRSASTVSAGSRQE